MPNQEKQALHTIYKGGFFKNRHKMMWRVPIFCEAIMKVFNPHLVVDVGCAIGDFVKGFKDLGRVAVGIEGSTACEPFMVTKDYIIHDLREPIGLKIGYEFDLAMCLEVAEHIEHEYSVQLVENLCMLSHKVLISAAPPGQKGHHHVNCQEIEYWDNRFDAFKFVRKDEYAEQVIEAIKDYAHKPGLKAYCQNLHYYEYQK